MNDIGVEQRRMKRAGQTNHTQMRTEQGNAEAGIIQQLGDTISMIGPILVSSIYEDPIALRFPHPGLGLTLDYWI